MTTPLPEQSGMLPVVPASIASSLPPAEVITDLTAITGQDIAKTTSRLDLESVLLQGRESGELSPEALPFRFINELFSTYYVPVMRRDLASSSGLQAVELTRNEVDALGCFAYVNALGVIEVIDGEMMNAGKLILFPEDFGDMDDADAGKKFLSMFPNGLGVIE